MANKEQDAQQSQVIPFNDMPPDLNPGQVKTWLRQETFLHAFTLHRTFLKAAKACRIPWQTPYRWKELNILDFNTRLTLAHAYIGDIVEGEAFRRIENPQKNLGTDFLLTVMLNAHKPDVYKPALIANDPAIRETLDRLRSLSKKLRDHETKANQEQGYQEAPDAIEQAQDILASRLPPKPSQAQDET